MQLLCRGLAREQGRSCSHGLALAAEVGGGGHSNRGHVGEAFWGQEGER